MDRMPEFSLHDYRLLLESLIEAGYLISPVRAMPLEAAGKTLYLRHDVDFHLNRQDEMAAIDAECGVASTFFVLLSGHYNPRLRENRDVIERILGYGHEVGLHYDLRDYPADPDAASEHLCREIELLELITGATVSSICMHEPSAGHADFFRAGSHYVHPHDPRWAAGLAYVSDSCRAWRDERLLGFLGEGASDRVLLNLHGELWLEAGVSNRLEYLRRVSAPTAAEFADRYFLEYMTSVWRTHEAVRLDAERRRRVLVSDDAGSNLDGGHES